MMAVVEGNQDGNVREYSEFGVHGEFAAAYSIYMQMQSSVAQPKIVQHRVFNRRHIKLIKVEVVWRCACRGFVLKEIRSN